MSLKELNEKLKQILNESPRLEKIETNLPVLIYISAQQGSHGPRIKFMNRTDDRWIKGNEISILICDNPKIVAPKHPKLLITNKELNQIFSWIKQNKEPLLDFWFGKIKDEEELKPLLTPLRT